MADYRCPKHDRIFESTTDHRRPGSSADGKFAAHPTNGHPDCPLCQADAQAPASTPAIRSGNRVSNVAA